MVSPAEKLRQVLDGYAVESEYGRKIDTYKDTILIDDQERDVNILRIGRLVLAYQTSDLSETGIYNKDTQSWEPLPGRYRNSIRDGIAMAKKVKTVDILELPLIFNISLLIESVPASPIPVASIFMLDPLVISIF